MSGGRTSPGRDSLHGELSPTQPSHAPRIDSPVGVQQIQTGAQGRALEVAPARLRPVGQETTNDSPQVTTTVPVVSQSTIPHPLGIPPGESSPTLSSSPSTGETSETKEDPVVEEHLSLGPPASGEQSNPSATPAEADPISEEIDISISSGDDSPEAEASPEAGNLPPDEDSDSSSDTSTEHDVDRHWRHVAVEVSPLASDSSLSPEDSPETSAEEVLAQGTVPEQATSQASGVADPSILSPGKKPESLRTNVGGIPLKRFHKPAKGQPKAVEPQTGRRAKKAAIRAIHRTLVAQRTSPPKRRRSKHSRDADVHPKPKRRATKKKVLGSQQSLDPPVRRAPQWSFISAKLPRGTVPASDLKKPYAFVRDSATYFGSLTVKALTDLEKTGEERRLVASQYMLRDKHRHSAIFIHGQDVRKHALARVEIPAPSPAIGSTEPGSKRMLDTYRTELEIFCLHMQDEYVRVERDLTPLMIPDPREKITDYMLMLTAQIVHMREVNLIPPEMEGYTRKLKVQLTRTPREMFSNSFRHADRIPTMAREWEYWVAPMVETQRDKDDRVIPYWTLIPGMHFYPMRFPLYQNYISGTGIGHARDLIRDREAFRRALSRTSVRTTAWTTLDPGHQADGMFICSIDKWNLHEKQFWTLVRQHLPPAHVVGIDYLVSEVHPTFTTVGYTRWNIPLSRPITIFGQLMGVTLFVIYHSGPNKTFRRRTGKPLPPGQRYDSPYHLVILYPGEVLTLKGPRFRVGMCTIGPTHSFGYMIKCVSRVR